MSLTPEQQDEIRYGMNSDERSEFKMSLVAKSTDRLETLKSELTDAFAKATTKKDQIVTQQKLVFVQHAIDNNNLSEEKRNSFKNGR